MIAVSSVAIRLYQLSRSAAPSRAIKAAGRLAAFEVLTVLAIVMKRRPLPAQTEALAAALRYVRSTLWHEAIAAMLS